MRRRVRWMLRRPSITTNINTTNKGAPHLTLLTAPPAELSSAVAAEGTLLPPRPPPHLVHPTTITPATAAPAAGEEEGPPLTYHRE